MTKEFSTLDVDMENGATLLVWRSRPFVKNKRLRGVFQSNGLAMPDYHLAAQYGAKAVDGIDVQEEMVELAKQATSDLDMVHIQVGKSH